MDVMTRDSTPGDLKHKDCSKCGVVFNCGAESCTGCWCDDLPKLRPVVEADCLCPACLGDALARQHSQPRRPLVEGEDYYAEGTVIVFTARYHLRRGFCCGRDCRHCPYR